MGVAAGTFGMWAIRRWLDAWFAGILHGVHPDDPKALAFAVLAVLVLALVVAAEPARRASNLDPAEVLRQS